MRDLLWVRFAKVAGWECLFCHPKQKLFLSVYVDDFRMAGPQSNVTAMWKKIGAVLDLEEAVPSSGNTYLGCKQQDVSVSEDLVKEKAHLMHRLLNPKAGATREVDPVDKDPKPEPKSQAKAKPKAKGNAKTNFLAPIVTTRGS